MNLIYNTDFYKHAHAKMLPEGTEFCHSFFESRERAHYKNNVFYGLQALIQKFLVREALIGNSIEMRQAIEKINKICGYELIDINLWAGIMLHLKGNLPLQISAYPEGTILPPGEPMFVVENTHPDFPWLVGHVETLLQNVWYPTTVATRALHIQNIIDRYVEYTGSEPNHLFDFRQRSCPVPEAAEAGGAAHLLISPSTATLAAIPFIEEYYGDLPEINLTISTEHSIMTAEGRFGDLEVAKRLIKQFPNGNISVVSDSYDLNDTVNYYCTYLKNNILKRNGKFIVRLDSMRDKWDTAPKQVCDVLKQLGEAFGYTVNKEGFRVLNPKVGVIYGDGLDEKMVEEILDQIVNREGWAADNCKFGGSFLKDMGRDTQKFAFKCSAQYRNHKWRETAKETYGKASKKGLQNRSGHRIVFKDGKMYNQQTFLQIQDLIKSA